MLGKALTTAAAGNAAGEGLYVEEVFSTYLWEGNGVAGRSIVNNIDVDGEGGLVWIKNRDTVDVNGLYTTDRGANKTLVTNETSAEDTVGTDVFQAFNSNGFTVGSHGRTNSNGNDYVSWTFRKAPKFFDVVTYTGNGATSGSPLTINHALEATVGTILVKQLTDNSTNWFVYHRSLGTNSFAILNLTNAAIGYNGGFNNVTSTSFDVFNSNATSGKEFVAYLFAHNDGDGEFGEDADQDIIKCVNSSTSGVEINLGFEPQWVLNKRTDSTSNWRIWDTQRDLSLTTNTELRANTSEEEQKYGPFMKLTPNGFINQTGGNYIYIAIRRGPMKTPTSGTEVFAVDTRGSTGDGNEPTYRSSFPVDMQFNRNVNYAGGNMQISARLTQAQQMFTNLTNAESANAAMMFDYMNGVQTDTGTGTSQFAWMFRRAPGFFDVVAYEGTGSNTTIAHNLGAIPELLIVKRRDSTGGWLTYTSATGNTKYLSLQGSNAAQTASTVWNDTTPTSSVFSIGTATGVNGSGADYIAYLFATVPGVSKVGSYTGNASGTGTQTIDCGFSNGARFVLIKCTSAAGNWILFDTERGITSGLDNFLLVNATDAQTTNADLDVDPDGSGFILDGDHTSINRLGEEYIFLAIA